MAFALQTVSELEQSITISVNSSEKRLLQIELAWQLREDALTRSKQILDQLNNTNIYEESKPIIHAAHALLTAYHFFRNGELKLAFQYALEASNYIEQTADTLWLARTLNLLGNLYTQLGDRLAGIDHLLQSLNLFQQLELRAKAGVTLHNIGHLYLLEKDYTASWYYLEQAVPIMLQEGSPFHQVIGLSNLSECLIHLEKYDKAASYLQQALTIACENQLIQENIAHRLNGLMAEKQNQPEVAHTHYTQALQITEADIDTYSRTLILESLGRLALKTGNVKQAQLYLEEGLELSEKASRKAFSCDIHQLLAQMYKESDQPEQALAHYEQYHQIYANLFSERQEQQLQNLRVIHETESAKAQARVLEGENQLLEQKVAERTQELTNSLEQRELLMHQLSQALSIEADLNLLKSRIISTVSHEFRTPLTIINTSAALLSKPADRVPHEKREQLYKRIQKSVFYITDLIQDVALVDKITKAEKVKPNLTRQQFNHMWAHLKKQLLYEVGNPSNIVFMYDSDSIEVIRVDYELIKQVALNLLSNALKYSGDTASLIIFEASHQNNYLIFSVTDHGIGIPEGETDNIFDLFYRASNAEFERGLGLGLYIVRQLAEAARGTVTAESAGLNQGSKFTVSIPAPAL